MRRRYVLMRYLCIVFLLAFAIFPALAQGQLSPDLREKIDKIASEALAKSGVPSASIAIVKNGRLVYVKAYGDARVEPRMPATPEMRYSIGSISKQFTVTAILLLQEQRKLSLDDKVAKFIPNLTRSKEVTIRQLLSHTSGYQDYWPQDYLMPTMLQPVTGEKILDCWARKPLDFDPGTKWQYSNTNYVIAGVIAEKASGKPLLQFLGEKVFVPLQMRGVANVDQEKLPDTDPTGYLRYALGPLRLAPMAGKGWLYAAGHRQISHSGEVSGFTAQNIVLPDDRVAVAVLTNQDAARAADQIANGIAPLLVASNDPATPAKQEQARKIFAGLQHGSIDRSLFTDNANAYFSEQALKDFAAGLGPLGMPQEFVQERQDLRGGMTLRVYRVKFAQKTLRAWTYEMSDGKLEQYQIAPGD